MLGRKRVHRFHELKIRVEVGVQTISGGGSGESVMKLVAKVLRAHSEPDEGGNKKERT